MKLRLLPICLPVLVMAALLCASAPVAAEAAAPPPDIVRLRDGGLVRGTIVELVPGRPSRSCS